MRRRSLLQLSFWVGLGAAIGPMGKPASLQWGLDLAKSLRLGSTSGGSKRVLVLLELQGGNDGLNCVGPFGDPLYQQLRGKLAVNPAEAIELGDGLAMHPALAALRPSLEAGRLAWLLGVGWNQPSRSHFVASDQWASGKASGWAGEGWLGRAAAKRGELAPLVALGAGEAAALEAAGIQLLHLETADLRNPNQPWPAPRQAGDNPALRRLLELEQSSQKDLRELVAELAPAALFNGAQLPATALGKQLALALRLIAGNRPPAVIQVSQGGYDTHANQQQRHPRLLGELAAALMGFERGLAALARRPQVELLTVSEFGRRLRINGSGGTDHGNASVLLRLGDQVGSKLQGSYPSLAKQDDRGDMLPTWSPPEVMAQLLGSGLGKRLTT
jgi:uncharacterized protein (DUF1501 family)